MDRLILFNRQATAYIVMLITGVIGVTAASAVLAQPFLKNDLPLQMAQSSPLTGTWRLANMTVSNTPTPMLPAPSTELTAEFAGDRISGSGGCNRFMGGFQTQGEQLSVGPLASTFKACEQSIMDQEMRYLKALEGAERYEVNDQGLTISYRTEQEAGVLRFTAVTARGLW
jgi:heat shock protein HslJ